MRFNRDGILTDADGDPIHGPHQPGAREMLAGEIVSFGDPMERVFFGVWQHPHQLIGALGLTGAHAAQALRAEWLLVDHCRYTVGGETHGDGLILFRDGEQLYWQPIGYTSPQRPTWAPRPVDSIGSTQWSRWLPWRSPGWVADWWWDERASAWAREQVLKAKEAR